MNFQNAKIYTIRSNQTDKYYIGSTNQRTLAQRLGKHRGNYKEYLLDNTKTNVTSFKILQYNDHYIELLENYPCNNKEELFRREGQLQRQFKSEIVNKCIAGRTTKEFYDDNKLELRQKTKVYREANKEKCVMDCKKYYEAHKEQISAKRVDKVKIYRQLHKEEKRIIDKAYRETHCNEIMKYREQIKVKNTYVCECGKIGSLYHKIRHDNTNKHKTYMILTELNYYDL